MNAKWKTFGSLLLMLIIGYLIGTFVTSTVSQRHYDQISRMRYRDGFFRLFDRYLDLNKEQTVVIEEVLNRHHERFIQVNEKHIAAIKSVLDSLKTDIKPHLTDDQIKRLDQLMTQGHQRGWKRHHPAPHPFPGREDRDGGPPKPPCEKPEKMRRFQ